MTLMSGLSGCDSLRDSSSEKLIISEAWKLLIYHCQARSCKNKILQWSVGSHPCYLPGPTEKSPPGDPASPCTANHLLKEHSQRHPHILRSFPFQHHSIFSQLLIVHVRLQVYLRVPEAHITIDVCHISRSLKGLFVEDILKYTVHNEYKKKREKRKEKKNLLQLSLGLLLDDQTVIFSKQFNCHKFS